MTEQFKRKPNTECLICKKSIYRRPAEIKVNKGHFFCSPACYGKFCRKEIFCNVCGVSILSGLNKKTCSRACSNKNRIGISYKINKPYDKVASLRRVKIKLFKIRGEKCERCNYKKVEILQIHHKNRNRDDNSLKNLEIICPNCHYEEHYFNHFKKD